MQEVKSPPTKNQVSLGWIDWYFRGCGYVAIAALITLIVLTIFAGYQAQDAMLGTLAITAGFGGLWMLGRAFKS